MTRDDCSGSTPAEISYRDRQQLLGCGLNRSQQGFAWSKNKKALLAMLSRTRLGCKNLFFPLVGRHQVLLALQRRPKKFNGDPEAGAGAQAGDDPNRRGAKVHTVTDRPCDGRTNSQQLAEHEQRRQAGTSPGRQHQTSMRPCIAPAVGGGSCFAGRGGLSDGLHQGAPIGLPCHSSDGCRLERRRALALTHRWI